MSFGMFESPEVPDDLFDCAIYLRNNIIGITTEGGSESGYKAARMRLMNDPASKRLLPEFVRHSNDAASVRAALSTVASGPGSWAIRRGHVSDAFKPILAFLETGGGAADHAITESLI